MASFTRGAGRSGTGDDRGDAGRARAVAAPDVLSHASARAGPAGEAAFAGSNAGKFVHNSPAPCLILPCADE